MKKATLLITISLFSILSMSCEDSASDQFEEANAGVEDKILKSVSVISSQNTVDNKNIVLSYNSNNQLSTINNGIDATIFSYHNGSLANVTGQNDALTIEELYESPYDAFETGEVYEYDQNGNPHIILFFEEEYNYYSEQYEYREYTAEVTYDNTHNPYFFTLEAAGIIEVLDGVRLNFNVVPQASEIVQARVLFPVNNPSGITYKNEEGELLFTLKIDYAYDEENYPSSASVTAIDLKTNDSFVYYSNFEYQ